MSRFHRHGRFSETGLYRDNPPDVDSKRAGTIKMAVSFSDRRHGRGRRSVPAAPPMGDRGQRSDLAAEVISHFVLNCTNGFHFAVVYDLVTIACLRLPPSQTQILLLFLSSLTKV